MLKIAKLVVAAGSTFFLFSCGGGGTDSVSSNETFDLSAAYISLAKAGVTSNVSVTGSRGCSGDGTVTTSVASAGATFEGQQAFSSNTRVNANLRNCSLTSISLPSGEFYNADYVPIGATDSGNYIVYNGKLALPTEIRVNDSGVLGSGELYSDSTKSINIGRVQTSYLVKSDTANTAIVSIATGFYNRNNGLDVVRTFEYVISTDSTLKFKSLEYAVFVNTVGGVPNTLSFIAK